MGGGIQQGGDVLPGRHTQQRLVDRGQGRNSGISQGCLGGFTGRYGAPLCAVSLPGGPAAHSRGPVSPAGRPLRHSTELLHTHHCVSLPR